MNYFFLCWLLEVLYRTSPKVSESKMFTSENDRFYIIKLFVEFKTNYYGPHDFFSATLWKRIVNLFNSHLLTAYIEWHRSNHFFSFFIFRMSRLGIFYPVKLILILWIPAFNAFSLLSTTKFDSGLRLHWIQNIQKLKFLHSLISKSYVAKKYIYL